MVKAPGFRELRWKVVFEEKTGNWFLVLVFGTVGAVAERKIKKCGSQWFWFRQIVWRVGDVKCIRFILASNQLLLRY